MKSADAAGVGFGSMSSDREEQTGSSLVVGRLPKLGGKTAEKSEDRLRVLVVDDSNTYRKQLCTMLEMEHLEVVGEAANGWEAIELNEQFAPDVVLMDQNMPTMSGIDAARRIKAVNPGTRIIFIAAEDAWREAAFEAGADGYFVKGDEMSELMSTIQHPAGIWQKPPGWPETESKGRRLFWPILGGVLALSLLAVIVLFPSVLMPILGIVTGLISLVFGLK
ncbi:MAG: response regulator transcription factor [Anaerolineales bacterium]